LEFQPTIVPSSVANRKVAVAVVLLQLDVNRKPVILNSCWAAGEVEVVLKTTPVGDPNVAEVSPGGGMLTTRVNDG